MKKKEAEIFRNRNAVAISPAHSADITPTKSAAAVLRQTYRRRIYR